MIKTGKGGFLTGNTYQIEAKINENERIKAT
jgi:hypothetical protein